uniref:DEP domain-containing protein n=1 Tax=Caenorhabditis tropicalis TaxID=1561998 RepID=A0A1I7TKC2_9PELO
MTDDYSTEQFKATHLFDEIVWHLRANLSVKTNRNMLATAENSFTGKDAIDFLLVEVPRIVPGKVPTKENMQNLLGMMVEWKVIAEAFPKKTHKKRPFSETRVYVFTKSLDELKKPKPRSRRSASFSGARKSAKIVQPTSPAATMQRPPKQRLSRRLSRSNGNVDEAGVDKNPRGGVENPGFDDRREEEVFKKQEKRTRPPKILNRSLESICTDSYSSRPDLSEKKEKVYDWLPFFKSRRYHTKAHQPTRRSVSLDRNHCMLEEEAEALRNKHNVTTPPLREAANDPVYLHPKGPIVSMPTRYQNHRTSIVCSNPASLSRGKMYESIMRRTSIVPVTEPLPVLKDCTIWKTELLAKLEQYNDRPLPHEWATRIDGYDIQWNMQEIDINDGMVRSRCTGAQPDYPQTVISFMDYLSRYPFFSMKSPELSQEYNVNRMFGTLVNRLEDLNAPLQSDECNLIISLLSKMDGFASMLETGAARRWSKVLMSSASSIEEAGLMVDGFSRDLPACGIRASRHRRRAISPFNNRVSLSINDEKSYKLREQWLIESIQLILLSLPTARRRKLHKFVSFIKSIETNEMFDLADPSNGSSNNREAAIIGLWTGVCGGCRKQQGMLITAVLLANYRSLFAVPESFVERVRMLEHEQHEPYETRYAKVNKGRRVRKQPLSQEFPSSPSSLQKTSKEVLNEKSKKGLLTRLLGK